MKIRQKINIGFLATFIFVAFVTGLIIVFYTAGLVRNNIYSYLESSNRARAEHTRTFIQDQQKTAVILAAASVYLDFLREPVTSSQYPIIKDKIIKRFARTIEADPEIYEVLIINRDGKIIASSNQLNEGADESGDEYFVEGSKSVFIKDVYFVNNEEKEEEEEGGENEAKEGVLTYAVAAPIKEADGTLLGVSLLRYKPDHFYSIVKNENGLGITEENFLVNEDKFFITPSRFLGNEVILKQKVETENINHCFDPIEIEYVKKNGYSGIKEEMSHKIIESKDYRNVEVIATHSYIPETGWCLVTKVDKSEAMAFKTSLIFTFISIFGFAGILFLLVGLMISKKITNPIKILQLGIKNIKEGNFNYQAKINTKDEMGELSEAFNSMTMVVKQSRAEIETKVEEQTKEIRNKAQELSDQKSAILNILEDVEKEKEKVELEKEKTDTILRSIGDAIFVVDEDKNIILINEITEKLSGYSKEEMIGKPYDQTLKFIFEANEEVNNRFVNEAISTGKIQEMSNHTLLVRKDGVKIPVSDSASPLKNKDGIIIGCVVVFRDVTHEREIDKAKTEFVSLASHQLKTPIGAIKWDTEMLLGGDYGDLSDKQKPIVKEISELNNRMVDLVTSFLNISRIELGTFMVEPVMTDYKLVCEDVIKELNEKIILKKHTIIKNYQENMPEILADQKILRIIFQNLLSNAVKYTKENGQIKVSIVVENDEIKINVADNGDPIPEKEQSKIFCKMYRASNAQNMDPDGNGLGLYLLKNLVEGAGGKAWFRSKEGEDTVFGVTFPMPGMKKKEGTKKLS